MEQWHIARRCPMPRQTFLATPGAGKCFPSRKPTMTTRPKFTLPEIGGHHDTAGGDPAPDFRRNVLLPRFQRSLPARRGHRHRLGQLAQRPAEQPALAKIDPQRPGQRGRFLVLDHFADHLAADLVAQHADRTDQCPFPDILQRCLQERPVDLQEIDVETPQIAVRRRTGTEIVEADRMALFAQPAEEACGLVQLLHRR